MIDLVNNLGYTYIIGYAYPSDPFIWTYIDNTDTQVFMQMGEELIGICYG